MNARRDKVLKRLVNNAMTDYRGFAGKLRADDRDGEVAAATIACMPGMLGAIVDNFQQGRLQGSQPCPDFIIKARQTHAGSVLRKGFTVTLENTPPVT